MLMVTDVCLLSHQFCVVQMQCLIFVERATKTSETVCVYVCVLSFIHFLNCFLYKIKGCLMSLMIFNLCLIKDCIIKG